MSPKIIIFKWKSDWWSIEVVVNLVLMVINNLLLTTIYKVMLMKVVFTWSPTIVCVQLSTKVCCWPPKAPVDCFGNLCNLNHFRSMGSLGNVIIVLESNLTENSGLIETSRPAGFQCRYQHVWSIPWYGVFHVSLRPKTILLQAIS